MSLKKKAIYIAATGQNVGKTTLCLGMMAALQNRLFNVGFIKPVGQQHVRIADNLNVDKDVVLFKDYFKLKANYKNMSPVILPSGFTRDFLDGKIDQAGLENKILNAFETISNSSSFTIVEGTGHIGVGSLIQLSNAKVAALLNLDVVIVASGGLGSAYDELSLNISLCQAHGVSVRGIILNRVLEHKRSMIEEYFPKALSHWKIPLMGCVPYNEFLSLPSLSDFEVLFSTELIAGKKHHNCHFRNHRLVAGSLEAYQDEFFPNELIITPATREDIILATIERYSKMDTSQCILGMILTSKLAPSDSILKLIQETDIPALYAPVCSYDAMKMITSLIAKIRRDDVPKIKQAIDLVEKNVNFDLLLN
jgi:hypothetical protein